MRKFAIAALAAGLVTLAACGGQGDDSLGDNAADAAEARSDQLEEMADNALNPSEAEALEARADAVEEAGEAREEAIDDADVNADAMTPAEKQAVTGQ